MSNAQLVNRIIASESELNGEKIKMGNLEEFEWEQIVHTTRSLFKAPMFIDDTPALSIREFRTKSRRLVSQYKRTFIDRRLFTINVWRNSREK